MRDSEFYRYMISKRAAVKALEEINKALRGEKECYLWDTNGINPGSYDQAIYSMADDIRRLKAEVDEYRKLKIALKTILK